MLDWLKTNGNAVRERLADETKKYKNKEFMEAVVAGCALVAAADGTIDSSEKQKFVGYMQNSEALKVFKMTDVMASFEEMTTKFGFDRTIGQGEALQKIAKIKGKDSARLLVRVCCAIGAADGDFDVDEKAAVILICRELELEPSDFDLEAQPVS